MVNFFMIVFEQSLIYIPLVLGAYLSFSLLKIPDLSLETAYLIGAFCGGTSLAYCAGYPLILSLMITCIASIGGGMLVGATSSCMTSYGKIPHLLSSIITFGLYHGIFQFFSPAYQSLAAYDNVLMLIPFVKHHTEVGVLFLVSCIVVLFCAYLFATQLGYSFAIFGYNPRFFTHFNISTRYVFITGVVLANGLAGLAGFLFAQTSNLIELNMAIGKSLFCITALILGRSLVRSHKITVMIPLCGVFAYFSLQQMLLKVGFNLKYFTMIQSLLVLIILLVVYQKDRTYNDQLGV